MSAKFTSGAWGSDPSDAMTIARFILRPTNRECAEQVAALLSACKLLVRLEPHLDAIVCFASTTDEHEPNALAADVHGSLRHLRDVGALAEQVAS